MKNCLSYLIFSAWACLLFSSNLFGDDSREGHQPIGQSEPQISHDDRREIREVTNELLEAAFSHDLENVVNKFVKTDQERLDPQFSQIETRVGNLDERQRVWKNKYKTSFASGIDDVWLPLGYKKREAMTSNDGTVVTVSLGNATEHAALKFVNEGVLNKAWRIDIPDSLGAIELNRSLERFNSRLPREISAEDDVQKGYQQYAEQVFEALSIE